MSEKLKKVTEQPWTTNKALTELLVEFDSRLTALEDEKKRVRGPGFYQGKAVEEKNKA